MTLSVVIPAYNEEEYISIPLNSLSNQKLGEFEIIICLNHCTDGTERVVKRIMQEKNLNIKIIKETRKGVSYARNAGFQYATGDIIASADADTFYPKDWTEEITQKFTEKNIDCLYGPVYIKSDSGLLRFSAKYFFSLFLKLSHIFKNYNLNGMNFAIRNKVFKEIGGFNTSWKSAEDIYIGIKLKEMSKEVEYDKNLIVFTHDRRFKGDTGSSLIHHIKNYINVFIRKKKPASFSDIR